MCLDKSIQSKALERMGAGGGSGTATFLPPITTCSWATHQPSPESETGALGPQRSPPSPLSCLELFVPGWEEIWGAGPDPAAPAVTGCGSRSDGCPAMHHHI